MYYPVQVFEGLASFMLSTSKVTAQPSPYGSMWILVLVYYALEPKEGFYMRIFKGNRVLLLVQGP